MPAKKWGNRDAEVGKLITRAPAAVVQYYNFLAKHPGLGFFTGINMSRALFQEFAAIKPWDVVGKAEWEWLRAEATEHGGTPSGWKQLNIMMPIADCDDVRAQVEQLKAAGWSVNLSQYLWTAVHWWTHYKYPPRRSNTPAKGVQ